MKKKLIALLLAVVMTLSLLPVTALAADGEELVPEEVIAEEPAAEEIPAEEPVVEELPVEEPAVEEIPAEEPVVEELPAEEPAVEETPAVEEIPAEELTTVENVVAAAVAITAQPVSATAAVGSTARFTVAATGANLTYLWQYRKTASGSWTKASASGYNTATISVPATLARNGYQYRCRVSSGSTTVNSNAATLTVWSITAQPTAVTVAAGSSAVFTVKASGSNLSYQWQYLTPSAGSWKNSPAPGNTTATLTVPATASKNGYQYRCRVTCGNQTLISEAAAMTVTSGGTAPTITTQPSSVTAAAGSKAKFTVTAAGSDLTYQWQYRKSASGSWTKTTATGYNTAALTVSAALSKNGYQYRCRVTSGSTTVNSGAATLTVWGISTQPANKSVDAGSKAKFTVKATGSNLSYQWQYLTPSAGSWKNSPATGSTTATLTIAASASKNGYRYRCKVTSGNQTLISEAATLTVNTVASVAINDTNFPDSIFRDYVTKFDTDGDGTFSASEIDAVRNIDIQNKDISSLKGVENFTALYNLRCTNCKLTLLDVSGITALEILDCSGNALTGLNVSGCTALRTLDCSGNALTALNVSENTALKSLDCHVNALTLLDVSKNTALTELDCGWNSLTGLDLSKNTALEKLYCRSNALTSLNVSGCTALQTLHCYENKLTILNVNKNTALTTLYCYSNELTALNVSKNTALAYLECHYNNISSLDISRTKLFTASSGSRGNIGSQRSGTVTVSMTPTQQSNFDSEYFLNSGVIVSVV